MQFYEEELNGQFLKWKKNNEKKEDKNLAREKEHSFHTRQEKNWRKTTIFFNQ